MSTRFSRRQLLARCWNGIGQLALADLLLSDMARGAGKGPHFSPKARSVIFLFFSGGVSQVDTFEYKPALQKFAGKRLPEIPGVEGEIRSFLRQPHGAVPTPFPMNQVGQAGRYISTAFTHLPAMMDELAFIHGIKVDSNNHAPSTMHVNTGSVFQGNPSVGAWVTYGLGSENKNLPGYIVLHDHRGGPVNGSAVWQSGYLPATYQGVQFRSSGAPILNLESPAGVSRERARTELDYLQWLNRRHAEERGGGDDLEARIQAYELAYRMQSEAPDVVDLGTEPEHIRSLYGLNHPVTEPFGRQCLMARRLVEKGVRFVLLVHGWENGIYSWDHHSDLNTLLPARVREVDQPVTALLKDLKQRGLWQDTLVVWTSEMGRTPFNEGAGAKVGRNHNQYGLVNWFAGGGVKAGSTAGGTDEFGLKAAGDPIPIRNVHATLLHLLGLDQMALTYLHEGRYKRLTDTGGVPLKDILT
ncbi:MAG: DUF1501 domain-containing protein [Acidobacteria bacterium]|nr:DUF1501 domain-containing protein [Acidobacteriota bacterium]